MNPAKDLSPAGLRPFQANGPSLIHGWEQDRKHAVEIDMTALEPEGRDR
jgi:hypothetical protein